MKYRASELSTTAFRASLSGPAPSLLAAVGVDDLTVHPAPGWCQVAAQLPREVVWVVGGVIFTQPVPKSISTYSSATMGISSPSGADAGLAHQVLGLPLVVGVAATPVAHVGLHGRVVARR